MRVRKPWTEEQRKNMSEAITKDPAHIGYKKYICKYCGNITNSKNKCCEECRQYLNYTRTFKKLGFTQESLKNRFDNTQKLLCEEYFDNKESLYTLESEKMIKESTENKSNNSFWKNLFSNLFK